MQVRREMNENILTLKGVNQMTDKLRAKINKELADKFKQSIRTYQEEYNEKHDEHIELIMKTLLCNIEIKPDSTIEEN